MLWKELQNNWSAGADYNQINTKTAWNNCRWMKKRGCLHEVKEYRTTEKCWNLTWNDGKVLYRSVYGRMAECRIEVCVCVCVAAPVFNVCMMQTQQQQQQHSAAGFLCQHVKLLIIWAPRGSQLAAFMSFNCEKAWGAQKKEKEKNTGQKTTSRLCWGRNGNGGKSPHNTQDCTRVSTPCLKSLAEPLGVRKWSNEQQQNVFWKYVDNRLQLKVGGLHISWTTYIKYINVLQLSRHVNIQGLIYKGLSAQAN